MSGLMARIRSRRADGAPTTVVVPVEQAPEEVTSADLAGAEAAAAPAETGPAPAERGAAPEKAAADTSAPTAPATGDAPPPAELQPVTPDVTPEADPGGTPETVPDGTPAGADPGDAGRPGFRARAPLRRRLRYLRRVRELAFRDLGGLVFDLDRFGRERPDLVEAKLAGLRAIDGELRALEGALADVPDVEELREAGIAACDRCGSLQGSDARFCPQCGTAVGTPAPATEVAPAEGAPDQAA